MPDDEVIEEEDVAETQTSESSSDIGCTTAEYVSDSVGRAAAAAAQQTHDNSEQGNT